MAIANQFAVPNLQQPPMQQPSAGDMQSSYDTYKAMAQPGIDSAQTALNARLAQLNNIRVGRPDSIQRLIDNGTALAASQGFSNADDLRGISPEDYDKYFAPKEDPATILARNMALADASTGASELRKNLVGSAQSGNKATLDALHSGMSFGAAQQQQRDKQTFDAQSTFDRYGIEVPKTNNDQTLRANALQEQARQANQSNAVAQGNLRVNQERLKLEASRQKFITDRANASATGTPATPGYAADQALMDNFDNQLKQFGALKKDGTGLNFDNVADKDKKHAVGTYLKREAAGGLPFGQIYQMDPEHAKFFGGSTEMILGKLGWHSITVGKDGKKHVSTQPAIPISQVPKGKTGSAGSTGTTRQEDVYTYDPQL